MRTVGEVYVEQAMCPGCRHHWSGPPRWSIASQVLGTRSRHVVLDVGCGLGGPAVRLASTVRCWVVALDAVPEVTRRAVVHIRRHGPRARRVRILAASAEALPVKEASIDQVWCLGVAAHLYDNDAFAREARVVFRPGGRVAVTEVFWDGVRRPRFETTAPQPWRPLTVRRLICALDQAGLTDIEVADWPGDGVPRAREARDRALRADMADGRLIPALVTVGRR